MAGFTDLPNEVVLIITSFVEAADLDNFFLISKFVNELTEEQRVAHLTNKSKYKRIGCREVEGAWYPVRGTWAGFLKEVIDSPWVSRPRHVFMAKPWNESRKSQNTQVLLGPFQAGNTFRQEHTDSESR